ncbi:MAG: alkaline phosphatase family protein [Candidatus Tumulicola sp.]
MLVRSGFGVALAATLLLASCSGGSDWRLGPAQPTAPMAAAPGAISTKYIKHIVLMIQENRSFDDLFATFPGADGATFGYTSKGQKVALKKRSLPAADINHDWATYRAECDLHDGACKMDGFNLAKINGNNPGGLYAYQYVDPNQVQAYWTIAHQYALLDHMFATEGSGSFTAHQDLIAGATAIDSVNSLIDYPSQWKAWGCDSPAGTVTSLITVDDRYKYQKGPYPCLSYPSGTLADLLDAKHVPWKYYAPPYTPKTGGAGSLWNAFAAIKAVREGPEWTTNIATPETAICNDVDNRTLPAFSWVIPDQVNSDHPRTEHGTDDGPAWIAAVVNEIGKSPYWKSTAIVIVWDDWGGFFDHVAPKQYGSGELGFRVPALVVSPYIGQGATSHTAFEFGSILKFAEEAFELGSLGTTDVRAKSIGSIFRFQQKPRAFSAIPGSQTCKDFLQRAPSYLPVDSE